jgi:hypothetical protein
MAVSKFLDGKCMEQETDMCAGRNMQPSVCPLAPLIRKGKGKKVKLSL